MGPHNINALNFPKMDNFNRKFCTFEKSFPTKNVQPGKISYYGTCFLYCAPQLPSAVHIDNFTIARHCCKGDHGRLPVPKFVPMIFDINTVKQNVWKTSDFAMFC